MKMELGLDTGPMIRTVRTPITQEDTSDTLMMRLAEPRRRAPRRIPQDAGRTRLDAPARGRRHLCREASEDGSRHRPDLPQSPRQQGSRIQSLPGNCIRQGRRPRQDLAGRSARALWSSRRSARHDEWSCDRLRRRRSSRHGSAEARQAQDGLRSLPSEPALYRW